MKGHTVSDTKSNKSISFVALAALLLAVTPVKSSEVSVVASEISELNVATRAPKSTRASKARKQQEINKALSSARVAFFEVFGDTPCLKLFDPFSYTCSYVLYDKNEGLKNNLVPSKKVVLNYGIDKIWETYYNADQKKGFDKFTRGTKSTPSKDGLVDMYLKEIPLCIKLTNEGELTALIGHLRTAFEKGGITPALRKPLLTVFQCIDGRYGMETLSIEDEAFLNNYFDIVSLEDESVRKFFYDSQKDMLKYIGDVYGSSSKEYKTDGVIDTFTRSMNKEFSKLHGPTIAADLMSDTTKKLLAIGIAGSIAYILRTPFKNAYGHTTKALEKNSWIKSAHERIQKTPIIRYFTAKPSK